MGPLIADVVTHLPLTRTLMELLFLPFDRGRNRALKRLTLVQGHMADKRWGRIQARSAGSQALCFAQPQCEKLRMPVNMASSSHESRMVSRG